MKTIEEIKEIIARKVAGQGNQIDLGGGVVEALYEICEVLDNVPKTRVLNVLETVESGTIEEVLQKLELDGKTPTFDELVEVLNPEKYNIVIRYPGGIEHPLPITYFDTSSNHIEIDASEFCLEDASIISSYNLVIILNEQHCSISYDEL